MIPGTESRFGAHCPLCKHFFLLCIVVEIFFIDLYLLSEMITSTSDWMNGQSQGLLDLKLPRSDYVIVLPDSRLDCFPQQTLAYSMVCSATVSHCAFSSNLFHGQIAQIYINHLTRAENKRCSPEKFSNSAFLTKHCGKT